MKDIFSKILESNKYVVDNALHVKINYEKLDEFVSKLDMRNSSHWLKHLPFGMDSLSIEEIINFLLIYHAMGFCYWGSPKWEVEYEGKKYDGAFGLISAFSKEINKNKLFLDFKYLSLLPYEEFEKILEGNIQIPLIKERYNNLIEVSKIVNEKMNSNFYNYIKDINSDIELLNIIVQNFPSFEDVSYFKGSKVYVYKRAQLLVSDILHYKHEKLGRKVDYTNLTGCADYKIPQVLRNLEITEYDDSLSNLVDNMVILDRGSIYEIEIRSTLIIVIDYIKNKLQNKYDATTISDYLWLQGQDKSNIKKPYHRTRTTAY
jgi:hypothetical protein